MEDEISVDESRRQTSFLAPKAKTYPAPVAYEDCGPFDDSGIYGASSWFQKNAVFDGTIIPRYASNGFLRGVSVVGFQYRILVSPVFLL